MVRNDEEQPISGGASERQFYRRLLELGANDEIEPLLDGALHLIGEVTGATVAYLELHDERGAEPRFWKSHGIDARALVAIRTRISRGIIGRAMLEGRTIETPSAELDERFQNLGSVRQNSIQAVLCVPVGV